MQRPIPADAEQHRPELVQLLADNDRPEYDVNPTPGITLTKAGIFVACSLMAGTAIDEMFDLGWSSSGPLSAEDALGLVFVGALVAWPVVLWLRGDADRRRRSKYETWTTRRLLNAASRLPATTRTSGSLELLLDDWADRPYHRGGDARPAPEGRYTDAEEGWAEPERDQPGAGPPVTDRPDTPQAALSRPDDESDTDTPQVDRQGTNWSNDHDHDVEALAARLAAPYLSSGEGVRRAEFVIEESAAWRERTGGPLPEWALYPIGLMGTPTPGGAGEEYQPLRDAAADIAEHGRRLLENCSTESDLQSLCLRYLKALLDATDAVGVGDVVAAEWRAVLSGTRS